ncbi:porin [Bradyrhizobium ganzhouense]|uniref:porin n=1 Tax=Bradyrhizobium ganzhouense TaxID=1179767 RepID=UPI003CF3EBAD
MKMAKSLLLSSTAGLIALSSAQAADLPVKAKAVEYVKVCTLYGSGFYYIPGTDTCIKLGGYLRAEAAFASNSVYDAGNTGLAGAHNRLSNYYYAKSRETLNIDTRTATEYGVVRTYFNGVFTWISGTYTGAGTTAVNGSTAYTTSTGSQVGGGSLGVFAAFIQFVGFTMGRAVSQFSAPWANYPANNFDGLPGAASWTAGVNQFSYTADFGQGVTASFSAQDPVAESTNIWNVSGATLAGLATGAYGASDIGGSRAPDLIAAVRIDQAWGLFQGSFAAHNNHAAYYGATEASGYAGDRWGWAAQLALSIKNIPTGSGDTINMSAVYTDGASRYNFHDQMNTTTFAMYGGARLAGAYQSVGLGGVSDSVFVTGSGQELTRTFGFQGGYTHNWNPNWATSIYGGWAAVRYDNAAKGYICGAFAANLALSSGVAGCNPDFNYGVIGSTTIWTPVKNLSFSADLTYSMLDQKYASGSTVALPLQSGVAKPGVVYELKDQNSLTMLLRVQRNW